MPDMRNQDIGTSPRVWGQALRVEGGRAHQRYIPSRVGTGPVSLTPTVTVPVHPHACGDRPGVVDADRHRAGTSPRVWGQDVVFWLYPEGSRYIPTRVGTGLWSDPRIPVHPHACGDREKERPL